MNIIEGTQRDEVASILKIVTVNQNGGDYHHPSASKSANLKNGLSMMLKRSF